MAQLLGPDGLPIRREVLIEEQATPSMTGVSHLFDEVVASGLTPASLARILRQAAEGDMLEFLTLAEEMEEREWQYRSVLSTRKTAIKSIDPFVQAPTEDKEDEKIADAVMDELVRRPDFRSMVASLMDALGKGYSAVELVWRTTSARWSIEEMIWRDPRLFQFDRLTRRELRLRAVGAPDGLTLAPFKFAIHTPELKNGLPARNGLARIAAWAFMLKSYTMKDWAAFLEVHGMPLRLGKYGPEASVEDRRVLLRAVRDLGSDAAAIIPRGMEIELVETKGFSDKPFEGLAKYSDGAISKIILGQTMTSDDGGSKAQAVIHDKVRVDIKEDDAVAVAVTINRDIIRPWVDLNFGPRPRNRYPVLVLPVMEREDLAAFSKAIGELVDRGLEVEQAEVRDRIGMRQPADGAKLMRAKSTGGAARERSDRPEKTAASDDDGEDEPAPARASYRLDPTRCPGCGTEPRTAFSAQQVGEEDEIDRLVADELAQFERVMDPVRDALEQAFAESRSYEELDAKLAVLATTLPVEELAARIAILNLKGFGLGRAGVDLDA